METSNRPVLRYTGRTGLAQHTAPQRRRDEGVLSTRVVLGILCRDDIVTQILMAGSALMVLICAMVREARHSRGSCECLDAYGKTYSLECVP